MTAVRVSRARPAVRAAAFAPNPQRRVMIAKVQIARKDLDFDDGDYRALLERITGKTSSTALTEGELGRVLDEFARLGWHPANKGKPGGRPADHPSARKARALWLSLGLLGAIRSSEEASLEAFARRQLGCERLQWSDQAQVYKLIEALKAIAERNGWEQSTAGLSDAVWTLKCRLCAAIAKRLVALGAVPPGFTMGDQLATLGVVGHLRQASERDLERCAAMLGARLAKHVAAGYYDDDHDR